MMTAKDEEILQVHEQIHEERQRLIAEMDELRAANRSQVRWLWRVQRSGAFWMDRGRTTISRWIRGPKRSWVCHEEHRRTIIQLLEEKRRL